MAVNQLEEQDTQAVGSTSVSSLDLDSTLADINMDELGFQETEIQHEPEHDDIDQESDLLARVPQVKEVEDSDEAELTNFEQIRDEQVLKGCEVLGPFKDDDEWELAKWLIHNVGHNVAEEFLKLPIPEFKTKQQLYDWIDELPQGKGIHWCSHEFDYPVKIVHELIGNPIFKELSQFRGDKTAWPVYLTISNISKDTCRKHSSHATLLLGYLPVPKFDCYTDKVHSVMKYRLFHQCMSIIMRSVAEAGNTGSLMVCTDSLVHNIYPIFAVYIANYPEQCLISCCMENRCPICKVDPNHHGTIFPPFWSVLPHSDIFVAFTLDLLHQLHKGVLKDHLVKWFEVDNTFHTIISHIFQWTGIKHKEMEKVFLMLVAAHACNEVVMAVCASLQSHTSTTLDLLHEVLDQFHKHKHIFIELEARSQNHFNIPKIHSMEHYEDLIHLFGSANSYNTEVPEHLHIDYAKDTYCATNHKDYIQQMTLWLQHQEAVD
ncbi:hypothetical protein ARMGADRAFT_1048477 [Armillaria gallica]|uniref:Uncharacterized protein n=1 Tax=Armillaria gallica TaxID=47427 RepID=A0A2H3CJD3_ARMGA|nr:hypothetical protein ARMGADRAFT_1048477 [Armillaria gallica]